MPRKSASSPFQLALRRYRRAKAAAGKIVNESAADQAIQRIDTALDTFLAAPSPDPASFGEKLGVLQLEYGLHVQPRHMKALYGDSAVLSG